MFEFREIEWANRAMRGKEFGVRGNTYAYLEGRGPHIIHCRTGTKPEQLIRLTCGANTLIPGFGYQITPIFAESPDATEGLNLNSLFLSSDGTDQWAPQGYDSEGHLSNVGTARENSALKPTHDYYWIIPEVVGGHPSWVPKIRITYQSTSSDDLADFMPDVTSAGAMDINIQGVPGVWVPKTDA